MNDLSVQRLLFDSPMCGQAVCDTNGLVLSCNDAFTRFLRQPAEEVVGRPLYNLLLAGEKLPCGSQSQRLRFLSGDGRIVWGDVCRLEAAGSPVQLLQVYDCTRAQLEEQLHRGRVEVLELLYRENSLAEICEAIVRYVESIDHGVRCSILLLDAEQGTLHKIAAPSLPDFYNDAIDGMRIGEGIGSCGTAVFRRERVVVADILEHPYWARARRLVQRTTLRACWSEPIVAHDGSVLGSFALYYDTPREPRPEELDLIGAAASLTAIAISHKRAEQGLRDLDRARDEFLSMATHELRTPLTAILGFTEILATGCDDPGLQREIASSIYESGVSLSRVINDLLDANTIQLGRGLDIDVKPAELMPILVRAINLCRHSAPRHQLELHCSATLPEFLDCDAGRLSQVLDNLLGNAVKYSPDGGSVVLAADCREGQLQISISDRGIGMSAAEVRRAFDRFYRARRGNGSPPGLGLGLGIARQIVESHGGAIGIESRIGEGTRITFSLPL